MYIYIYKNDEKIAEDSALGIEEALIRMVRRGGNSYKEYDYYCKIDENDYFISYKKVICDEATEEYVRVEQPVGFIKPMFDFDLDTWVEGYVPPLPDYKQINRNTGIKLLQESDASQIPDVLSTGRITQELVLDFIDWRLEVWESMKLETEFDWKELISRRPAW